MISINLIINLRNPFRSTEKLAPYFHLFVWGYAILTTAVVIGTGQAGRAGDGTCWISMDPEKYEINPYQFTFFAPLLIYFLLGIVALIYTSVRAYQTFQHRTMANLLARLRIFVFLFILMWSGNQLYLLLRINSDLGPIAYRIAEFFNRQYLPLTLLYTIQTRLYAYLSLYH